MRLFSLVKFSCLPLLCITLGDCTTVPPLDGPANVPISKVVDRIKCDLQRIVSNKVEHNPEDGFLLQWTSKVHLTLAVDNTASLNPGATIINPLPNAMPLGGSIGAVSQSFSLGIGGGATTEAIATTDIEFFLSLKETEDVLKAHPEGGTCVRPDGSLLDSDLQLDALFDRALAPVEAGTLTRGHHPGFGTTPPAVSDALDILDTNQHKAVALSVFHVNGTPYLQLNGETQSTIFKNATAAMRFTPRSTATQEEKTAIVAQEYDNRALEGVKGEGAQTEQKAQAILKNIIVPAADILAPSFPGCSKDVTQLKFKGTIQAVEVSNYKLSLDHATDLTKANSILSDMTKNGLTPLERTSHDIVADLKRCQSTHAQAAKVAQYDPIDLISQTINFYITVSGSVNPAWKLVRVSAPIAPALGTASRKYTDTMIIAFGRPDPDKPGSTALSNQILTSTLRDALVTAR